MTFEHPAFLPLVLLPLVAYTLYLREIKKRNSRIVHFTGTTMLETLSPKPRLDRTATVVGLAGVVLLALAQSGPGIVLKEDVSDNSIVLVIDVSGSMTATDATGRREERRNRLHSERPERMDAQRGIVQRDGIRTVVPHHGQNTQR